MWIIGVCCIMYTNRYLNSFCFGLVPFSPVTFPAATGGPLCVEEAADCPSVTVPKQSVWGSHPQQPGLPGNQEQQPAGLGTAKLWTGVTSHNPPETTTAALPRPVHGRTWEALHILSPLPGTIFPTLCLHRTNSCSFIKSQLAKHFLPETFPDSADWVGISVFSCSP